DVVRSTAVRNCKSLFEPAYDVGRSQSAFETTPDERTGRIQRIGALPGRIEEHHLILDNMERDMRSGLNYGGRSLQDRIANGRFGVRWTGDGQGIMRRHIALSAAK